MALPFINNWADCQTGLVPQAPGALWIKSSHHHFYPLHFAFFWLLRPLSVMGKCEVLDARRLLMPQASKTTGDLFL